MVSLQEAVETLLILRELGHFEEVRHKLEVVRVCRLDLCVD
jgi:hypothetical protein